MKHLLFILALSCFGQDSRLNQLSIGPSNEYQTIRIYRPQGEIAKYVQATHILTILDPTVTVIRDPAPPSDARRIAVDVVSVADLKQLGAPAPPSTTDHIRVIVRDLDPATVKVTIRVTYFDGSDEVVVERTTGRNEVGATISIPVQDAKKITSPVATIEELAPLP